MNSTPTNSNSPNEEHENSLKLTPSTEFVSVPSFLLKTYEIVDDPTYDDIIRWNDQGDAFIIAKSTEFSEQILPMYFKHKNLSSFIRQLNMYGFRKTKGKTSSKYSSSHSDVDGSIHNQMCFTHEHFIRTNKKLLLKMKRHTKANEKKASDPYIRSSEVLKIFKEMQERIDEQDKKINNLVKMNKEFKNSVLALYTELEKSKEREKMMSERQMTNLFNAHGNNENDITQDNSTYRCSKEEMMSLFKAFVEKFIQSFSKNPMQNMFYDNSNNDNCYYLPRKRGQSNAHERLPFDLQNYQNHNMLENGNLSSNDTLSEFNNKTGNNFRKRDAKALALDSSLYGPSRTKKVSELKSTPSSPKSITRKDLAIGFNRDEYENNGLFLSRNDSVMSDYDGRKHLDNISLSSQQKFDEFLAEGKYHKPLLQFADHHNFEVASNKSKGDMSSIKSDIHFSPSTKLCGTKRK